MRKKFHYLKRIGMVGVVLLVSSSFSALAQMEVEKRSGKQTYVYDYAKKKIYNKSNNETIRSATDGFTITANTIVKDVFREVMSPQRTEVLKKEVVIVTFVCRADGQIESVDFLFPSSKPFLSPEEVRILEEKFLNKRFPVKAEPGIEKVKFSYHVRINEL